MVIQHIYTGNLEDVLKREEVEGVLFGPILITSTNKEDLTPKKFHPGAPGMQCLSGEYRTSEIMSIGTFHIYPQPPYELAEFKHPAGRRNILYGVIVTPLKVNEDVYKRVFRTT